MFKRLKTNFYLFFVFIFMGTFAVHLCFRMEGLQTVGLNTDLTSHWMSGILFLKHGLNIFRYRTNFNCPVTGGGTYLKFLAKEDIPKESVSLFSSDLCETQDGDPTIFLVNWSIYPRFYPVGVLLYGLPAALLYWKAHLSFSTANHIVIIQVIFVGALLCFFLGLFYKMILPNKLWQGIFLGLLPFLFLEIARWSIAGFYDGISVTFLILSLIFSFSLKEYEKGLLLWACAFFLHYRALWYFPVVAINLFYLYPTYSLKIREGIRRTKGSFTTRLDRNVFDRKKVLYLLSAFVFISISFLTLKLALPIIREMEINNPVFWKNLTFQKDQSLILGFFITLLIGSLLRCWKTLLVLVGILFILLQTREVRLWHSLFLIPVLLMPEWESSQAKVPMAVALVLFLVILRGACFSLGVLDAYRFFVQLGSPF